MYSNASAEENSDMKLGFVTKLKFQASEPSSLYQDETPSDTHPSGDSDPSFAQFAQDFKGTLDTIGRDLLAYK